LKRKTKIRNLSIKKSQKQPSVLGKIIIKIEIGKSKKDKSGPKRQFHIILCGEINPNEAQMGSRIK
jgi:hypothetical protein